MPRRVLRAITGIGVAALVGSLLSVVVTVAAPTDPASASPPASAWNSGLIITDSVMFDPGRMTLAQVKSFLAAKGANCVAHTNSDGSVTPCLKDYKETTYGIKAVANRCEKPYDGVANETAAAIIWKVAQACSINPQVLIVLLQKEQGLVTASGSGLTPSRYNYATGFACPDTAGCDTHKSGFFRQVYSAAYGFQNYAQNSYYSQYAAGRTSNILYNPNRSCGTQSVAVQNAATHALYVYTPYVPNAAALNHPYATGDSCSSYGNRNFWLYFNDWFGSPLTGTYFVDTDAGYTYLVIAGVRWKVTDDSLLSTYKALGSVGRVSTTYANSLPYAGVLGQVAKTVDGSATQYWLMTNAGRIALSTCAQVTEQGVSCSAVPTFTVDMIDRFPVLDAFRTSSGAMYLMDGGVRYKLPNDDLAELLEPDGGYPLVGGSGVNALDYGGELAPVITDASAANYWLIGAGGRIPLSSCAAVTALGYDCTTATPLSLTTRSKLPLINAIRTPDGTTSVLIDGARWTLPSGSLATAWSIGTPTGVTAAFAATLPAGGTLGRVVKAVGSTSQFELIDGGRMISVGFCSAVHGLGLSCPSGPTLTPSVAALLTDAGALSDDIVVGSARFHVVDPPAVSSPPAIYPRVKKQVLTTWSALHAGVDFGANGTTTLSADAVASLTYGAPYVDPGLVFTSGSTLYMSGSTTVYSVPASLRSSTGIEDWLGAPVASLDAASVAAIPTRATFSGVYADAAGTDYAVASTRPIELADGALATAPRRVDAEAIALLPAAAPTAYGPSYFVRYLGNGLWYLVQDGVRHPIATLADKNAIAAAYGISASTPTVALDTLAALGTLGTGMVPPSHAYRTSSTSTAYWFLDGSTRRSVSAASLTEITGSASVRAVSSSYLAGYPIGSTKMTIGLICDGTRYLAEGGVLRSISATDAAQWPVTFLAASATTCASRPHYAAMGTLVTYGGTYWHIVGGKRGAISAASYQKLVAAGAKAAPAVDATFLSLIPTK